MGKFSGVMSRRNALALATLPLPSALELAHCASFPLEWRRPHQPQRLDAARQTDRHTGRRAGGQHNLNNFHSQPASFAAESKKLLWVCFEFAVADLADIVFLQQVAERAEQILMQCNSGGDFDHHHHHHHGHHHLDKTKTVVIITSWATFYMFASQFVYQLRMFVVVITKIIKLK